MKDDERFVRRLYTVAEAARFVGMPPSTLGTWAQGYERRLPAGLVVDKGPVITSLGSIPGDRRRVPFVGLVEAAVVQAFRQTGLSMQRIRLALEVLAAKGELEHALASRHLYSDGAEILYDYACSSGDSELESLTVVRTGQRVFQETIMRYLEHISFEGVWAGSLILPVTERPLLRVRPRVQGGNPIFINGGAPLSAVRSRLVAGESVASVAHDYGVPSDDITEAIDAIWPLPQAA